MSVAHWLATGQFLLALDIAPAPVCVFLSALFSMSPDSVSIVIPVYNEARRLPPTLAALADWQQSCARSVELIIVVEPGTDRTREIATEAAACQPNLRVIANEKHRGKGFAVRTGVRAATGDIVFYMDADLSVPLREVDVFLEYFRTHADVEVLFGNRQHAESRITKYQSWLRRHMGQTFNAILRRLAMIGVHDTQCGFKAFRRPAAQVIFARQQIDGFAFDVEVLLLAQKIGFRIADLPVEWRNSPESKVRIISDSLQMLWDALRIRRMINRG
jgi:dolichyl-phosphate beta-glucosyltransferase